MARTWPEARAEPDSAAHSTGSNSARWHGARIRSSTAASRRSMVRWWEASPPTGGDVEAVREIHRSPPTTETQHVSEIILPAQGAGCGEVSAERIAT